MIHYLIAFDLHTTANDNRSEDYKILQEFFAKNRYCQEQKSVYLHSSEETEETIHERIKSLITWDKEDSLLVVRFTSHAGIKGCFKDIIEDEQKDIKNEFKRFFNNSTNTN